MVLETEFLPKTRFLETSYQRRLAVGRNSDFDSRFMKIGLQCYTFYVMPILDHLSEEITDIIEFQSFHNAWAVYIAGELKFSKKGNFQMNSILEYLLNIRTRSQAGYLVLIDPDKKSVEDSIKLAQQAEEAKVDALLVGGSLLISDIIDDTIKGIKKHTSLPVIIFPGAATHLSPYADAVLFLSLISGNNPNYLIGEHVKSAPLIKRYGLEPIPTGYMLIESGTLTSVGFMSATLPIPREKTEIAWTHALAAEYLGMKLVYLEAGSGAHLPVPDEMITDVKKHVSIPIIVGGGIRTPEVAVAKVRAGADFIVTGNVLENSDDTQLMRKFAEAIHQHSPDN